MPMTMPNETDQRGPKVVDPQAGLFRISYLRSVGSRASTIIDVGVNRGTPELYAAFKDKPFILIDPQRNCQDLLKNPPRHYTFVNKAVGSKPGTLVLHEESGKSSLMNRTALTEGKIVDQYEVEVTTMDSLLDELQPKRPYGIKIDTEGFEVEVIKGMARHIEHVDFLVCEASVRKRFIDGYTFSDIVCLMKDKGFEFANIMNPIRPRPRFYDVLFVRANHPILD